MAHRKSGPTRPCRIFLCYRRETAQTAITFKGIMDLDPVHEYGNVWYSNLEGVGNFILDVPDLIGEAEWVIFFVGKAFTAGFLDENEINPDCVTAQELIAVEKERQKRISQGRTLRLMTVNVDGACFDRQCVKDLKQLFLVAGILREDTVAVYRGLNQNPYHSVSTLPHDFIEEHVAPYCALPAEMVKTRPVPEPESPAAAHNTQLKWLECGNLLFGNYPQTAGGEQRPIEWLVLKREAKRALLISRCVLDAKPYHETATATTWAECSLRSWLNGSEKGDFFEDAFTDDEKKLILTADVAIDSKLIWNTSLGNPTADKVFLLSIPEAYVLFLSNVARCCAPTDYAIKQSINQGIFPIVVDKPDGTPNCFWWLRSPRNVSIGAPCVGDDGFVYENGAHVDNSNIGVRPALWINL